MPINNTEATMRVDYSDEWHKDFERETSMLKPTVNSTGIVRAKTVTFDTASVTGRAKTRQRDGELPYSRPDTNQVSKDLYEHFEPYIIDDWDLFRNNSETRALYMQKARAVVYREMDQMIVDELDQTTVELNSGSAIAFSQLSTFLTWTTTLWNNDVPADGNVYGLVTPAAWAQMMRIPEFKSSDYTVVKRADEGAPMQGEMRSWMGVKWMMFTGLTGHGTATASCYIYHKSAIGHKDDGNPTFMAGYDDKNDQHWCWARVRHCAKAILTRGIVRAVHDDTAAFA